MVTISTLFVSLYISASYVGSIYSSSLNLEDFKMKRDDQRVIKARMGQVSKVLMLNCLLVPLLWHFMGHSSNGSLWASFMKMGLVPGYYLDGDFDLVSHCLDIVKAVLLLCLLYVGVLADVFLYYCVVDSKSSMWEDLRYELDSLWGFRNYVFAPVTEELFYTSMLITTYLSFNTKSDSSFKEYLWETPLYFGLAHIHHAYEEMQTGTNTLPSIMLSTLFQLTYTTLFGSLTNYTFLCTGGNLWACIALHSFCNFMGFPQSSKVSQHYQYTAPLKNDDTSIKARIIRAWSKIYIALLIMGILLFKDYLPVLLNNSQHRITL
ncbi:hypothetical protein TPHA_0I00210 [Tetrapisispora phaffii CBS 4417]|uniref:intramembrane prenyl-peptidase Rce1 n=1 Tax=Tetrapisispora phaffii (strain ATCC 24235 / CBS 4417 / NBRC 1672 / NRRL Y-8282 / UCD 70-5) TaxID=1071381 RepID=G8BXA0_TETPH|nr:hypothetical protein TPHA_0I00210 [Tetrapisispora phaffii CBS 4417]CCE64528.1 hypothetical protein TPHA_0I00210 [Tetrapisispora phaffii CBS 4417]